MIIIMRFGENNVLCPKYIDIYKFCGVRRGHTYSTIHFLFIIQKNRKSNRAWPILKSNSTSLWFKFFFLGRSEYSSSNWFHNNTPNSRHVFNTNNTNMYLIHFHSKNIIKMPFPQNWVFKVQNWFGHSLSIGMRWNKLRWHQQRLHNNGTELDLKKKV